MIDKHVYIADIKKVLPQQYCSTEIADTFYPAEKYGPKTNQLVKRLSKSIKIDRRPCVLDLEAYPNRILKQEKDHPVQWGSDIIQQLTGTINKRDIGFFSLSYNVSFNLDTLPNLATQMALSAGLENLDHVEELPYYGCAASIFSLESAIAYCREYDRPALVFTFDQCFEKCLQLDSDDEDFKKMMLSNLIFTDGGVGLLIIPERLKDDFDHPVLKIKATQTKYKMGTLIGMKKERFLMSNQLKNVMPKLVSDLLVKPFFKQQQLALNDIQEWAVHQGGTTVIKQFCDNDILGLTASQIERSLAKFKQYGNTSSASCLLVLESFFNEQSHDKEGIKGILLGFGAGYYLGVLLYEWT